MKKAFLVVSAAFLVLGSLAYCKDHSNSYQMGTYVTSSAVADGMITDIFDCDPQSQGSTVCSGRTNSNGVTAYRIDIVDGFWILKTRREAEKKNPLDLLKNGDKVLFRVEARRKLNETEADILIPFASNPDKEAKFIGTFSPAVVPGQSNNVRAMCDAHKLSPQLEKKYCTRP